MNSQPGTAVSEAPLCAARESPRDNGFAIVAMLALLGLRIFEATGANIEEPVRLTATASWVFTARETRLRWSAAHLRRHHARGRHRPPRRTNRGPARRPKNHHALRPSPQGPGPAPTTSWRPSRPRARRASRRQIAAYRVPAVHGYLRLARSDGTVAAAGSVLAERRTHRRTATRGDGRVQSLSASGVGAIPPVKLGKAHSCLRLGRTVEALQQ